MNRGCQLIAWLLCLILVIFALTRVGWCECAEQARLLSVGRFENKMVVVSLRPSKERVMLVGETAKIVIFGRPGEWRELINFSLVRIRWERRPIERLRQTFDGELLELCVEAR